MIQKYDIYTDGACLGNPGPGGFGWVLLKKKMSGHEKIDEGSKSSEESLQEKRTTNNRMELMAVIDALETISKAYINEMSGVELHIFSDSQYVLKGFTEWLPGWKRKGWKGAGGKAVKNVDLWIRLEAAVTSSMEAFLHEIHWHWVKGHNGDAMNEYVDGLANTKAGIK